jgi:hypothetical protein
MNADDDGYCEHFSIMRMVGSKPDDLKILHAKGFVNVFDDHVLVIMDWKENNYLRSDRYTPSKYLEKYKLELKQIEAGIPDVNQEGYQLDTQDRIGKDRIGKEKKNKPDAPAWRSEFVRRARDWFYKYSPHLLATESDWKREMPFIIKFIKDAEIRAPGKERQEKFIRDILDVFSDICEGEVANLKYLKESLQLMPRHLMSTKIWPLVLGEYEKRKGNVK